MSWVTCPGLHVLSDLSWVTRICIKIVRILVTRICSGFSCIKSKQDIHTCITQSDFLSGAPAFPSFWTGFPGRMHYTITAPPWLKALCKGAECRPWRALQTVRPGPQGTARHRLLYQHAQAARHRLRRACYAARHRMHPNRRHTHRPSNFLRLPSNFLASPGVAQPHAAKMTLWSNSQKGKDAMMKRALIMRMDHRRLS